MDRTGGECSVWPTVAGVKKSEIAFECLDSGSSNKLLQHQFESALSQPDGCLMSHRTETSETPQEPNWSEEVRRYLPAGLKLAVRLCGEPQMAEDLLQEALLRVARHRHQFRGDCAPATWIGRILINVCRDWQRRRVRQQASTPLLEGQDVAPLVPIPMEVQEQQDRLRRMVQQLPQRQQEVFVLRIWQEMSPDEIAETLEISVQNVYANLSAARKQLQSWLPTSDQADFHF